MRSSGHLKGICISSPYITFHLKLLRSPCCGRDTSWEESARPGQNRKSFQVASVTFWASFLHINFYFTEIKSLLCSEKAFLWFLFFVEAVILRAGVKILPGFNGSESPHGALRRETISFDATAACVDSFFSSSVYKSSRTSNTCPFNMLSNKQISMELTFHRAHYEVWFSVFSLE